MTTTTLSRPSSIKKPTNRLTASQKLDAFLLRVTPENKHKIVDDYIPQGNEIW